MGSLRQRVVAAVLAVSVIGMGLVALISAPATASSRAATTVSAKCDADVVFIGVRGTGAPAGTDSGDGGRTWNDGGFGQVAGLAARFTMDASASGTTAWVESLDYPASLDGFYLGSMNEGARALKAELDELAGCATPPKVVLAGHSQGAHVILQTLAPQNEFGAASGFSLTAQERAMITGVVLFGDPSYVPGEPWNAPGSGTGWGIFPRRAESLAMLAQYTWEDTPAGASQPQTTSKIRSYCVAGDAFCQSGLAPNAIELHNDYMVDFTNDAYAFLQRTLRAH